MKKAALYSAIVLLLLALFAMSVFGLLGNFVGNFLLFGCVVTLVLTLVSFFRSQIAWDQWRHDVKGSLLRVAIRSSLFLLMGIVMNISIIPLQLGESASLWSGGLWVAVTLLCLLSIVPREADYRPMNLAFGVMLLVIGFQVLSLYFPPSSDAAVVARSPFEDDWYVFQGGNSALVNHHFFGSSNKYALDLVIAEDIALPMTGVLELDQYATFGTAVFAPVAGVVVKVESAIDDQPVGHIDHINPTGNYVVIQVSPDVHVILAHLQQESLKVSEGEVVAQGQLLGNIGNSGQSSQPHLHIHAMTGADMFDPDSQPLPIVWQTKAEPVFLRRNETLTGFAS